MGETYSYSSQSRVLTTKELADRLQIGRDKAYALIKSPSFPAIRLGARYIVTEQALSEWLINNQYRHIVV